LEFTDDGQKAKPPQTLGVLQPYAQYVAVFVEIWKKQEKEGCWSLMGKKRKYQKGESTEREGKKGKRISKRRVQNQQRLRFNEALAAERSCERFYHFYFGFSAALKAQHPLVVSGQ